MSLSNDTTETYETNSSATSSNETGIVFAIQTDKDLKLIKTILVSSTVLIVMMSMGADICWKQIWKHIRNPFELAIGVFCQFVIMPLAGFLYNKIFRFGSETAIGLLIISCCPGGILSNVYSYYINGEVSLSVSLTTLSTILALGMMPFNVWIYSSNAETNELVLPYGNMALSLVMITSPVLVGMAIKWKLPKASVYVTKFGSALGFILFMAAFIVDFISFKQILNEVSFEMLLTTVLMPLTGIIMGYFLAFLCRKSHTVCRTVAVESGIQNVPVAVNIISLSFDDKNHKLLVPWFYLIAQIVICSLLCLFYHATNFVLKKFNPKKEEEEEEVKKNVETIEITSL